MTITGTLTYDIDTKQLSPDCDDKYKYCVHDTLSLPVVVAQDKTKCQLADGDKGFTALTLAFDNKHNGLLVFACKDEALTKYRKPLGC